MLDTRKRNAYFSMKFETIAVAATISVEAAGKDTFFHLSKEAQSRKEPIKAFTEAFSDPRNGGFFGDKRRALSNNRVQQWPEATNIQSEHAKGASAEEKLISEFLLPLLSKTSIAPKEEIDGFPHPWLPRGTLAGF